MNTEKVVLYFNQKKFKLVIVFSLSLIISTLIFFAITFTLLLQSGNIYDGVHVNGIYAGKITPSELRSRLEKGYQDNVKDVQLSLYYKDKALKIPLQDIGLVYEIDSTVNKAYGYGRNGNILDRLSQIFNAKNSGYNLEIDYTYDKGKLDSIIDDFSSKNISKVKQPELVIGESHVSIRSGHSGEEVDKALLYERINSLIKTAKDSHTEIPTRAVIPEKMDLEYYYSKISLSPSDASVIVKDNKATVVPHVVGRSVDKSLMGSIAAGLEKNGDTEAAIPVQFIMPENTTDKVKAKLFSKVLSSWSTKFSTNTEIEKNRSQNIRVAVSKINGRILAPGEVFSFNSIVGERTEKAGFKDAFIYVDGKVLPGLGGGICQVSTTLYGAVLPLGFEVIERRNHMFTVSYSALGMDAAVAYGQVDFKFRNTSKWPIKIFSSVSKDNRVVFSIVGTGEEDKKAIAYESKTIKVMENATKYINDPTLEEGKTKIKQKGSKGYIVDTYKVVKQDGKVIKRSKIYSSYYKPLDKEILKGTKKVTVTAKPKTAK